MGQHGPWYANGALTKDGKQRLWETMCGTSVRKGEDVFTWAERGLENVHAEIENMGLAIVPVSPDRADREEVVEFGPGDLETFQSLRRDCGNAGALAHIHGFNPDAETIARYTRQGDLCDRIERMLAALRATPEPERAE